MSYHPAKFGSDRNCYRDFTLSCGWEPVKINHYPARLGNHKHYGVGVLKEFVSLTMVAMEMGKKRDYFSYHSNSCKGETILHQKHESFTFELPLKKLS